MELPKIIESPDFQAKLKTTVERFANSYRKLVPDFTAPTPADPLYHILVEITLNDVIGIERVNHAAYAQLVKLSNEIDFIFKGKIREGESFEAYRERMRGTKDLASPAGSTAMYKALSFLYGEASIGDGDEARKASVVDAHVQTASGQLLISVLINSDATDLKETVLRSLTRAFEKETIRPPLDSVTFIEARPVPFSISAVISLDPGYTEDHRATIESSFRQKFESHKKLGWAPSVSWIVRELHQTGVRSLVLTSPESDIPVQAARYATISRLELTVEEAT